ncbi:hypothetical protein [Streptomyces sp. NPDC058394]|uniref:hypothetical protein n=1 Tax=Streptomyces sp. NPDC058394 TaxID=3346477 RepID=UPI0036519724
MLIVRAGSVKNSHHHRSQGTSSFPEKLSTGIKPVDPGSVNRAAAEYVLIEATRIQPTRHNGSRVRNLQSQKYGALAVWHFFIPVIDKGVSVTILAWMIFGMIGAIILATVEWFFCDRRKGTSEFGQRGE